MNRVMIIPAAGLGSRLGGPWPKLLTPVNGKAMIDYLVDLYISVVDRFVIVVNPSAEGVVRSYCARWSDRIEFVLQAAPTGMLDAILLPQSRIQTMCPHSIWVTWCDQIAVHPETVQTLQKLSDQDQISALSFPTVRRQDPYTHMVRNSQGEIINILHRREGDRLPACGESEMGLFSLSRHAYFHWLSMFAEEVKHGHETEERNFLPFIAWLHGRGVVRTFPAKEEIEAIGINTPSDLKKIEEYFSHAS